MSRLHTLGLLFTTIVAGLTGVMSSALADGVAPERIAATWTADGVHLDLFATDTGGSAVSTWWEHGCGWQPWFAIGPGSAKFKPGQPIAALWNGPGHLDLFAADKDGRVVSTWWEGSKSWQPWFAIHPEGLTTSPGQPVTPVWNGTGHLDIFVTDRMGRVASTWWETAKSWQPWFLVHPESAHGAPGQEVTALWNGAQHLDLFMTDNAGRIVSTWWESAKSWQPWFAIHADTGLAAPGQTVTAIWAAGGKHLDLFMTDRGGRVMSTWWESAKGWQPWFAVQSGSGLAAAGQAVTARWSTPTHLDLFIAGVHGQVLSTWWEAARGWQPWFAIQPDTLQVKSPQTITVLWNGTAHADLFTTASDGTVASTWWEAARSWQAWFRIFPGVVQARVLDSRNVATQGFNAHRTGEYSGERTLRPDNIATKRFGQLYSRQVEGQMFAQPLYLRNVETRGRGTKNLVLLATTANQVYGFDADNTTGADGEALVYSRKLHPSAALDPAAGNTSVGMCDQTYPYFFGITATPVIDPATDTMYVVSYDTSALIDISGLVQFGAYVLHALDLRDGLKDRVPPVQISAPGFLAHAGRNRAGLLLMNGVVYVAFASFICDHPLNSSGWVFGYRTEDLTLSGAFRTDPQLNGAGIWQSGRGLVGEAGQLYFMTGNESAKLPRPDTIANSIVKLNATCHGAGLTLGARFTPSNSVELSLGDTDLASSGPVLLPGNRIVGGGKQGRVYVLNASSMKLTQNQTSGDGFQGFQGFENTWHNDPKQPPCAENADAICRKILPGIYPYLQGGTELADVHCDQPQTDPLKAQRCAVLNGWIKHLGSGTTPGCYLPVSCYQFDQGIGPNLHAGFVYWQGFPNPAKGRLYALAEKDYLKAFEYDIASGHVNETPVAVNPQIRIPDGMPGGALSISSDGGTNGVLWVSKHDEDAMMRVHPGHFYAVDASTLRILWEEANIKYFAKFNPPTIADGKVFLATWAIPADAKQQVQSTLVVYGLKP